MAGVTGFTHVGDLQQSSLPEGKVAISVGKGELLVVTECARRGVLHQNRVDIILLVYFADNAKFKPEGGAA